MKIKKKRLGTIRPSAAVMAAYHKQLAKLVDDMTDSVKYWLRAAYRKAPPPALVAKDALSANYMQNSFELLVRRWQKKFSLIAKGHSREFVRKVSNAVDQRFIDQIKQAGIENMSVDFKMTEGMRNIFNATVNQNISLIKSVPEKYFDDIQYALTTAVTNGRDLSTLTDMLENKAGVAKRRAAFIARSQVNIATATMHAQRGKDMGLKEATWHHSAGGKHPRSKHVAFNGHIFDVTVGHDFGDGAGYVLPGQAPNCRCTFSFVIEGF